MNQNGTLQPNSEFPQIGPDNQQNACAYTNYDSMENFLSISPFEKCTRTACATICYNFH